MRTTKYCLHILIKTTQEDACVLGLTINCEKSKIMIFRNSKTLPAKPKISINKTRISIIKHFSYLGYVISNKNISKKAFEECKKNRIVWLRHFFCSGLSCGSPSQKRGPEVIRNQFLRKLYGIPMITSIAILRREFNVLQLGVKTKISLIPFSLSILERPHLQILQNTYQIVIKCCKTFCVDLCS